MRKITGDEPAFPNALYAGPDDHAYVDGMTLRQYYSGLAMQGLCSNTEIIKLINEKIQAREQSAFLSDSAVELADALINSLNKSEK